MAVPLAFIIAVVVVIALIVIGLCWRRSSRAAKVSAPAACASRPCQTGDDCDLWNCDCNARTKRCEAGSSCQSCMNSCSGDRRDCCETCRQQTSMQDCPADCG